MLPVIVISYSLLKIFIYVRSSHNRVSSKTTLRTPASIQSTYPPSTTKEQTFISSTRAKAQRDSIHLAFTLGTIFLVFVTCWVPYALVVLFDPNDTLSLPFYLYVLLLAHLHATVNSIIYGITNNLFRQAYLYVFGRCICHCRIIWQVPPTNMPVTRVTIPRNSGSKMAIDK